MKISNEILAVLLGATIAVQGWTLKEVVSLDTRMAALEQHVSDMDKNPLHAHNNYEPRLSVPDPEPH